MKQALTIMLCVLAALTMSAQDRQLAFPGADGYGRYVTGGRGGKVYYVTRTDDCPDNNLVEGTLRWALRSGNNQPRTVLFNTHGTIYLTSKLKMNHPNVSILGQSAPGGGVCLAGFPLCITADNVIVRYVRFRAGDVPDQSMTGLDLENCRQVILDHCSMTWSMEESLTAYDTDSTTVQWCIIGEALYNSKNAKGERAYAMQWGGEHSTMHHTLVTNSHSRSPRFNGVRNQSNPDGHDLHVDSEFANNVVFNWSGYNSIYGGENASTRADAYNRVYMINNYYRPGPSTMKNTGSRRYFVSASGGSISEVGQWYLSGNKFETNSQFAPSTTIWSAAELQKVNADNYYGFVNNNASRGMSFWSLSPSQSLANKALLQELPYALSGLTYETADAAYGKVTTQAGAALPRYDEVDRRLLDEAAGLRAPQFAGATLPDELGIIDSPDDITLTEHDTFTANGVIQTNYPFLGMRDGDKWAVDTDCDGLPDPYETELGLNPHDANDAATVTTNGYTILENYLNGIADGSISKSRYETSDTQFTNYMKPESVTFSFDWGNNEGVEGTLPADTIVKYGTTYTLPDRNTSLYKEGYTLTGWAIGNTTYALGSTLTATEERTLTPVFSQNRLNLTDRPTAVTVVWDFTRPEAPHIGEGKGIYVSQTRVENNSIDVRLGYDGHTLTMPACEGATATVSYADGQQLVTATSEQLEVSVADDAGVLRSISLWLPFVMKEDTHAYHAPQLTGALAYELVYTPDSAFIADTEWAEVVGGDPRFTHRTCQDPKVESAVSEIVLDGITINNSTRVLNLYVTGTATIRAYIAGSNSTGDRVTMTATPNDGMPGDQVTTDNILARNGTTPAARSEVVTLDLDKEKKYRITFTSVDNLDMMVAAVKLYPETYIDPADAGKLLLTTVASPAAGGSIQRSPSGKRFVPGTEVELTARPAADYLFSKWTNEAGETIGEQPQLRYTVNEETTLTAHFQPYSDHAYIFTGGVYQAEVRTATELLVALGTARQRIGTDRYRIFLHNGTYDLGATVLTEVPSGVSLIGESMEGVVIVNHPNPATLTSTNRSDATPTLYLTGNDIYMQDLTVRQGIDWQTGSITGQAQAIRARGDRLVFKQVSMQGCQDTYYINKSTIRNYLEDCRIAGDVDFIYGDGTAFLNRCTIYFNNTTGGGYITAPNTPAENPWGIVISDCTIDGPAAGNGKFYLGRPWNDSPAVTYVNNTFRIQPVAAGWAAMTARKVLRFHEYGSMNANGQKLDLSVRNTTACYPAHGSDDPVITAEEAAKYTIENVLTGSDAWQPTRLTAQLTAPELTSSDGALAWISVEGAYAYAICKNGEVVGFTKSNTFRPQNVADSDVFSIRVANSMGGLGLASNTLSGATGIRSIDAVTTNGQPLFDLSGRRLNNQRPAKGIYIKKGKKMVAK